MRVRRIFVWLSILTPIFILLIALIWKPVIWSFVLVAPLVIIGYIDYFQKTHTIRRNFPIIGNFRYILESVRPEIMQYFVETDTEGRPLNRVLRSMVYQRSKNVTDTISFGTQMDVYEPGYEWINHSMYAKKAKVDANPRIMIGGDECTQPYSSSILNISAMSYGALSKNAVLAMGKGAKMGGFAQNTGEGGISPFHLKYGNDLIWQIGTGYFGCRDENGKFSSKSFAENAKHQSIKMIEIKISQGAKPGHGGILPAKKNTKEIAEIRQVEPYTEVDSPPSHSAFEGPEEMMHFIRRLRNLSGGKPVGFKVCIGLKEEFEGLCKAMIKTGILPDFIAIDGGEGATGAAPVEFSNSVGMPLLDALAFTVDALRGYGLKNKIRVIASGKIVSSFHIARVLAIGADLCYSARAMMLSVGCIQALKCNSNDCPVGVATQDKVLMKGLDVDQKSVRIYNFHKNTMRSFGELISAAGLEHHSDISRKYINLRVETGRVVRYDELYPEVEEGAYLEANMV